MGPRAELEVALLHVEGEPAHVNVAGALQDAWRNVLAVARGVHQHVGVEGGVEALVGTAEEKKKEERKKEEKKEERKKGVGGGK